MKNNTYRRKIYLRLSVILTFLSAIITFSNCSAKNRLPIKDNSKNRCNIEEVRADISKGLDPDSSSKIISDLVEYVLNPMILSDSIDYSILKNSSQQIEDLIKNSNYSEFKMSQNVRDALLMTRDLMCNLQLGLLDGKENQAQDLYLEIISEINLASSNNFKSIIDKSFGCDSILIPTSVKEGSEYYAQLKKIELGNELLRKNLFSSTIETVSDLKTSESDWVSYNALHISGMAHSGKYADSNDNRDFLQSDIDFNQAIQRLNLVRDSKCNLNNNLARIYNNYGSLLLLKLEVSPDQTSFSKALEILEKGKEKAQILNDATLTGIYNFHIARALLTLYEKTNNIGALKRSTLIFEDIKELFLDLKPSDNYLIFLDAYSRAKMHESAIAEDPMRLLRLADSLQNQLGKLSFFLSNTNNRFARSKGTQGQINRKMYEYSGRDEYLQRSVFLLHEAVDSFKDKPKNRYYFFTNNLLANSYTELFEKTREEEFYFRAKEVYLSSLIEMNRVDYPTMFGIMNLNYAYLSLDYMLDDPIIEEIDETLNAIERAKTIFSPLTNLEYYGILLDLQALTLSYKFRITKDQSHLNKSKVLYNKAFDIFKQNSDYKIDLAYTLKSYGIAMDNYYDTQNSGDEVKIRRRDTLIMARNLFKELKLVEEVLKTDKLIDITNQ